MSSPSLEKFSLSMSSLYRSKRILLHPCGDVFTVLGEVFTVCEQPLKFEEGPSSSLWRCLHRPWRSCHCLRAASTGRRGSFFVPVEMSSLSLEKFSLSASSLYRLKRILSSLYRSRRILLRPCGLHRPWRSFHCLRAASTGRRGSFFVPVEMSSPSLKKFSLPASSLYRPKRILLRPC